MTPSWTQTQIQRLTELNAPPERLEAEFEDTCQRDQAFLALTRKLVKKEKAALGHHQVSGEIPRIFQLETDLALALAREGFVRVRTPVIMAKGLLAKMGVTREHPLYTQMFQLDNGKFLRPMLAPHLYFLVKDLLRLWEKPVRIFEMGSCFRKESEGARHASEFTMLNLCEFGLPENEREKRLASLATLVMTAAGIKDYTFESEHSAVYGTTLDVVAPGDLELGSGAMGPHPLDRAWKINETWVGIGFGVERLLMARHQITPIKKVCPTISFMDGIRLNL